MKPYSKLTIRGQARRLRKLAFNALAHYNLEVIRMRLITNDMNGIFRIDTEDTEKYILRVTLPEGGHTLDHVTAEMDWLAALARDTDLSVPRPVPAKNGSLVIEASADGIPEARLCEIFSWVGGNDLFQDMSKSNIANLGELSARLHSHALTYIPPPNLTILRFDKVFPFPEPVVLFEEQFAHFVPAARRLVFERAIGWAQDSIDMLKASREPMRIIHGDLHQWNVRLFRGMLSPIDFEDLMLGWPVQDIATTLYYFPAETYPGLRAAFQEGYTRKITWPEKHAGEMDSFIAARGLGLANFILNDPNPAWRDQALEFVEWIEERLLGLMRSNGII